MPIWIRQSKVWYNHRIFRLFYNAKIASFRYPGWGRVVYQFVPTLNKRVLIPSAKLAKYLQISKKRFEIIHVGMVRDLVEDLHLFSNSDIRKSLYR